jgi:hypothetical protein
MNMKKIRSLFRFKMVMADEQAVVRGTRVACMPCMICMVRASVTLKHFLICGTADPIQDIHSIQDLRGRAGADCRAGFARRHST